jgi:hypothetical protein
MPEGADKEAWILRKKQEMQKQGLKPQGMQRASLAGLGLKKPCFVHPEPIYAYQFQVFRERHK